MDMTVYAARDMKIMKEKPSKRFAHFEALLAAPEKKAKKSLTRR